MEDLSIEVGQIRHDKDEDGFYNSDLVCVPGDKTCKETPQDANDGATKRHHKEWSKSGQNVCAQDVDGAHLCIGLKHVIQHLQKPYTYHSPLSLSLHHAFCRVI